uniref:Uncharacterized protein n=1 Tax=Arundo donax TaxID=35708 RepID=A0A0A9BKS8_ARUDO
MLRMIQKRRLSAPMGTLYHPLRSLFLSSLGIVSFIEKGLSAESAIAGLAEPDAGSIASISSPASNRPSLTKAE